MKELKEIYYESGIWLKYNWYDFLIELADIMKLHKPDSPTLLDNGSNQP